MTDEELAGIEARCNAATAGPWEVSGRGFGYWAVICEYPHSPAVDGCCSRENATFIAHARTDVSALLAEVRRLRGLVKAAYHEGAFAADPHGADDAVWADSDARRALEWL